MLGEVVGRLTFTLLAPLIIMALVGGVYWLRVRPQRTFWQAMFRWWVVAVALAVWVVGLFGQLARMV